MSWIELNCEVECPHCGNESTETAEFNTFEGDFSGINSRPLKAMCWECGKGFWYMLRVNFEIEVLKTSKKEIKNKEKRS